MPTIVSPTQQKLDETARQLGLAFIEYFYQSLAEDTEVTFQDLEALAAKGWRFKKRLAREKKGR